MAVMGIPIGEVIGRQLVDAEQRGPFRLAAFLQPFLLFVLPNLVLFGAILFTIAALARQTIPVYLGAIGLFIAYLIAANNLEGLENPVLFALADPLGLGLLQPSS